MARGSWLALFVVGLTFVPAVSAAQPILETDPCGYVSFSDKAKRDEYDKLASKLRESEPYKSTTEEWRSMAKSLRERISDELFGLWAGTYGAVQNSVRSPILEDVQTALMDRCLNRIRRTPQKETDVIRADIELMRSFLALSDAEFQRQFRARMKATADALGTAYAAGDTLRANLGLPRPN